MPGIPSSPIDPILDLLPPPFEWCDIPAGFVVLEYLAGVFHVEPFKMAKYPITYAQFQVFIDASDGFQDDRWWQGLAEREKQPEEQKWKIANHPREHVSWFASVAFCRWLSQRVGYEVRLPTELEWQWAAEGLDARRYPWGDESIQGNANIDENMSGFKDGVYLGETTPVDRYPQGASPFGVLDMVGNVWEWCLNEFETPSSISMYRDEGRVLRGGSFDTDDSEARSAYRIWYDLYFSGGPIGFRLVASPI